MPHCWLEMLNLVDENGDKQWCLMGSVDNFHLVTRCEFCWYLKRSQWVLKNPAINILNFIKKSPAFFLQYCNPKKQVKHDNSISADVPVHRPWPCSTDYGDLTHLVGAVFLCPGRTSGTSCHLTFGKCPISQNNLLAHWKLFSFQTALTSTSEDNIKRRAMAKTSTSTCDTGPVVDEQKMKLGHWLLRDSYIAFTLLVVWQEGHQPIKTVQLSPKFLFRIKGGRKTMGYWLP